MPITGTPQTFGAALSVADSDALALLPLDGITIGTTVWNEDVGAAFKLTACIRTVIDAETTDGYDDPTWTFATATFTGHEGDTLVIVPAAPNEAFAREYVIDTVGSATEVDVLDPPDGATSGEFFGSVVLVENALETDVTVAALGVTGARWIVVSDPTLAAIATSGSASDLVAGQVPVARAALLPQPWTAINVAVAVQDVTISGLNGDVDTAYEFLCSFVNSNAGASSIYLMPNNLNTNQETTQWYTTAGGGAAATTALLDLVNGIGATGGVGSCHFIFKAKTGAMRMVHGQYQSGDATGAMALTSNYSGVWKATTGNVTSLVLHSNQTTGIGVGTQILWRKIPVGA